MCGYAAVNGGKHCELNGHCVVCRKARPPEQLEEWKGEKG